MAILRKNKVILLIILLTIGLVLLVIWIYDQRIHHPEITMAPSHKTNVYTEYILKNKTHFTTC